MSGGPIRKEVRDYDLPPILKVVWVDLERRWDAAIQVVNRARRFERMVGRLTRQRGLSFCSYLVLEATNRILREKRDAVSQRDIAQRTGLTKSTVSDCVGRLWRKGLLDVQPDAWGSFDRILMTATSEQLLASLRAAIDDRLPQPDLAQET